MQSKNRSVLQRRARGAWPPATQASAGYAAESASSTAPAPAAVTVPSGPPTALGAAPSGTRTASTMPNAAAAAPAPAAAAAAASAVAEPEDGRAAAPGIHRARRARRGDDEPFLGNLSSNTSSEPQGMAAVAAPGTRWRCSICGLLIDDQTRARRHCATAHGSQPCEPVEVPSTAGSANARPSAPTGSTGSAGTGTTGVAGPSMVAATTPPPYAASSIMPPVAPIFNATRDMASPQAPLGGLFRALPATSMPSTFGGAAGQGLAFEEQVRQLRLDGQATNSVLPAASAAVDCDADSDADI